MLSFRKKLMSQSQETYGQPEEGTDRPYFIGPFLPRPGIQQPLFSKYWWEYTKSCFNENAKIFSKNFATQENIIILRLK